MKPGKKKGKIKSYNEWLLKLNKSSKIKITKLISKLTKYEKIL